MTVVFSLKNSYGASEMVSSHRDVDPDQRYRSNDLPRHALKIGNPPRQGYSGCRHWPGTAATVWPARADEPPPSRSPGTNKAPRGAFSVS